MKLKDKPTRLRKFYRQSVHYWRFHPSGKGDEVLRDVVSMVASADLPQDFADQVYAAVEKLESEDKL